MANSNDERMTALDNHVRRLREALEQHDAAEAKDAMEQAHLTLWAIDQDLRQAQPKRWITADSGPDYLADDPRDPRD